MNAPTYDAKTDEGEEAEEPEIGEAPAPPPEPEPDPEPEAPPVRRGPGRPPGSKNIIPGVGAIPKGMIAVPAEMVAKFEATEAVELANQVFERLRKFPIVPGSPTKGLAGVEQLSVEVHAYENGNMMLLPGAFEASLIDPQASPGKTAGALLYDYVVDNYHMTRTGVGAGPSRYAIRFRWKRTGKLFAGASMHIPSVETIRTMRRGQEENRQRREPSGGYSAGYGAPPPGYGATPQAPPLPPWSQPGYQQPAPPAPAPAPSAGTERERYLEWQNGQLHGQIQGLQGQVQELIAAVRENRMPNIQAPAPAPSPPLGQAPPQGVDIEGRIRSAVAEGIGELSREIARNMGIGPQSGMGGAPTAVDKMRASAEGLVGQMIDKGFQQILKGFEQSIRAGTGMGAPSELETAIEPETPPDPRDDLPFTVTSTGGKWPDGTDIVWSENKESGGADLRGIGFGNPYLAEKVLDIGKALVDAGKTVAERWANPNQTRVVSEIPKNARDAQDRAAPAPNGQGWPTG